MDDDQDEDEEDEVGKAESRSASGEGAHLRVVKELHALVHEDHLSDGRDDEDDETVYNYIWRAGSRESLFEAGL